jgi:hypothetical protein
VRWLRTIAWRSDFRLRSVLREAADRKLTFEITFFDAGSLAAHIYLKTTGPL